VVERLKAAGHACIEYDLCAERSGPAYVRADMKAFTDEELSEIASTFQNVIIDPLVSPTEP
jgi:hypothetical protein